MTEEELCKAIIKNIEVLGVKMVQSPWLEGTEATINNATNIGFYDPTRITPFILAHELVHVQNHDESRTCDYDIKNPAEKEANVGAVEILWSLYLEVGGTIDYISTFLESTHCPTDLSLKIIADMIY